MVLCVERKMDQKNRLFIPADFVEKAGGEIVGKMAILAEGDATERDDLIYLEPLPLFDKDGNAI